MLKNRHSTQETLPSNDESPSIMNPAQVLKTYKQHLNIFEVKELFEYSQIYYLGKICCNKSNSNHVYDNEYGEYTFVIGDHIAFRYEIINCLGKGSFGQVLKCFDHKEKELVAIKIIKNNRMFLKQATVELQILKRIAKYGNDDKYHLLQFKDHFFFREHLCISSELLSYNLYDYLQLINFQGLPVKVIQSICLQILSGLLFLHKNNIVHCDLKPENVLLISAKKSAVKIIDFGSSCFSNQPVFTYIQSRFYRAPEVLLGAGYNEKIDIWSLGCILVELFLGYPLFTGRNEEEQLGCIINVLGKPPNELLRNAKRNKEKVEAFKANELSDKGLALIRDKDSLFYDFLLSKIYLESFEWNPEDRMSTEDALKHPWSHYKYE